MILKGRLVRDPELRMSEQGNSFCRFTVAVDRPTKEKAADFLPCVAFGKTAELVGTCFFKGKEILLEGRIQTGSYEAKDGTKRYTTDIMVDRVEFCGNKSDAAQAITETEHWTPTDDDIPF